MRNNYRKEEVVSQSLVAVAIDKDKGSQYALKWAADHLVTKGQTIILIHVSTKSLSIPNPMGNNISIMNVSDNVALAFRQQMAAQNREMFLPFRCFCTRRDIRCKDVILEEADIPKALTEYVSQNSIENLVMGASSRNVLVRRFKGADVPASVSKTAPDFCSIYVISKGKISSARSATRQPPGASPLLNEIQEQQLQIPLASNFPTPRISSRLEQRNLQEEIDSIRGSPFDKSSRGPSTKSYGDICLSESDISFVSSDRASSERAFPPVSLYDHIESTRPSRVSNFDSCSVDTRSYESVHNTRKSIDQFSAGPNEIYSTYSNESPRTSCSSQLTDEMETEMRRLKLELKQTMEMYSAACKEALTAKQKAKELHMWKMEEEQKLEEARLAEEAALTSAEKERAKCRAALEAAEVAKKLANMEAQNRLKAETKAAKEMEESKRAVDNKELMDARYRKYAIEDIEEATGFFAESRKIGEGGYGPVYKCYLDHTPCAVKVLRPDAAQGRSQFQQEVAVLSCIRHPNMVLLLGACPEYGCLVYEYMANGSLEDRLFHRGNSPALTWQHRFRISAEIATALLFLHQTKPEPIVHRDLKPGNILLDRNYVSKISDVGLARLVPPSVANAVTQYLITSTAGTFCYIDPEYQQTGMLGVKSDVYSLGIMLLQLLTGKPPMGLTHKVERAIENGSIEDVLDPQVTDWPVEEALNFANLALKCAELRRKDRPDLGKVVLPELNKLREMAESLPNLYLNCYSAGPSSYNSGNSSQQLSQEIMSESQLSGYESRSSVSSAPGKRISMISDQM